MEIIKIILGGAMALLILSCLWVLIYTFGTTDLHLEIFPSTMVLSGIVAYLCLKNLFK